MISYLFFVWRLITNVNNAVLLQDGSSPNRTLDLASSLEIGQVGNKISANFSGNSGNMRSVMTIAFQFAFESQLQQNVASMARQYMRSIISSVQRVALALSPSRMGSLCELKPLSGSTEALNLARWIDHGYRFHVNIYIYNVDLLSSFLV